MASRSPLTAHQIEILEWIHDGHPENTPLDYSRRISAGWLARRDLVTIKGRGPKWSASLTIQGLDALAEPGTNKSSPPKETNEPGSSATSRKETAENPSQTRAPSTTKPKPKPKSQCSATSTSRALQRSPCSAARSLRDSTNSIYQPYLPGAFVSVKPSLSRPAWARLSYTANRSGAAANKSAEAKASPDSKPGSAERARRPSTAAARIERDSSVTAATATAVTSRTSRSGCDPSRIHVVWL